MQILMQSLSKISLNFFSIFYASGILQTMKNSFLPFRFLPGFHRFFLFRFLHHRLLCRFPCLYPLPDGYFPYPLTKNVSMRKIPLLQEGRERLLQLKFLLQYRFRLFSSAFFLIFSLDFPLVCGHFLPWHFCPVPVFRNNGIRWHYRELPIV